MGRLAVTATTPSAQKRHWRRRTRQTVYRVRTADREHYMSSLRDIERELNIRGFAVIPSVGMRRLLGHKALTEWLSYSESWNALGTDTYMADGGRYRRRRFGVFEVSAHSVVRKPHQPHYQSRDYNTLNGGIERWFEPVTDEIGSHTLTTTVLLTCHGVFDSLTPSEIRPLHWHAEIHQFRIEARERVPGLPTPEGVHRDGVDWVFVALIRRENVASGVTTIRDQSNGSLDHFTLCDPLDAVFLNDQRVHHGVTAITPINQNLPAYRDALVITFRLAPPAPC